MLIVSNFNLTPIAAKAAARFDLAAEPDQAQTLYNRLSERASQHRAPVATGIFRASMNALINNGR